jgi:hypothetical protein
MEAISWKGKKTIYDEEGHVSNLDVWDWIVTNDGRVMQITHDEMSNLSYTEIKRFATTGEVHPQKNS